MSQGEGPLHVPLTSSPGLRVTFRLDGSEHSSNTCPHRNGATDQGKGTAWFFPVDPHQDPSLPTAFWGQGEEENDGTGKERGDETVEGREEGGAG